MFIDDEGEKHESFCSCYFCEKKKAGQSRLTGNTGWWIIDDPHTSTTSNISEGIGLTNEILRDMIDSITFNAFPKLRQDTKESIGLSPSQLGMNTAKKPKERSISDLLGSAITAERHNGKRYFSESINSIQIVQRNGKPFFTPEVEQ